MNACSSRRAATLIYSSDASAHLEQREMRVRFQFLSNFNPEFLMPKKIRVEADICAPKPVPPKGYTTTTGHGQKISLERGSHTRSKKNPGKRPKKGG